MTSRTWFAVAVACGTALLSAQAADRLATEIARVATAAAEVLPEDSRAAIGSRLERAKTAAAAGQTWLALYDLQVGYEGEAGYRLASTRNTVPDHAAFTRKWTEMGAPADPPATKARVLFVEALAQSAEGRAPATYKASLPYAQDAGLEAGLYYLGESHAMVRFASFCRSLDLKAPGRWPSLRSIEPELAAYEKQVVKAYDAAPASQRPQYAGVNVAIKLARTLDEQKRYEGALLQYLVSRYRYAILNAARQQPPPVNELKTRLANTKPSTETDHSIAEFFTQLAQAALSGPQPAPASAAAILDDILPAYSVVAKK